jgi:peptidoglycan L-alanyl-D-glutamate endopeptidase CwlK
LPGKPFGSTNTNADGVIHKSNHQVKADGYGHAVDLYPYVNGKVDYNGDAALITIADHIMTVAKDLKIAITWGGNWKPPVAPVDKPHFELKQ